MSHLIPEKKKKSYKQNLPLALEQNNVQIEANIPVCSQDLLNS